MKNKTYQYLLIFAFLLCLPLVAKSQSPVDSAKIQTTEVEYAILEGTVVDEQAEPTPFVNVVVKNDNSEIINGCTTDMEGKFSLKFPRTGLELKGLTVEVSSLGYETQILKEVNLNRKKPLMIKLKNASNIDITYCCYSPCRRPFFQRSYTSTVYDSDDIKTTYR